MGEEGKTVLEMRKFEGTSFAPTLKVALTDATELSFDQNQMANGVALEVFYHAPEGDVASAEIVDAVAINLLEVEEAVNYNGKLLSVTPSPDHEGQGQLEMALLDGNETQIIFNYGPETKFHQDPTTLKPGDLLNIYHQPLMTMSLPPQSPALEVSAYTAPEETAQPITAAARATDAGAQLPKDAQLYEGKVVSVAIQSINPLSGMVEMTDMEGKNPYLFLFDGTLIQNNVDVTTLKPGDLLSVSHSMKSTRSLPPQSTAYSFSAVTAK